MTEPSNENLISDALLNLAAAGDESAPDLVSAYSLRSIASSLIVIARNSKPLTYSEGSDLPHVYDLSLPKPPANPTPTR